MIPLDKIYFILYDPGACGSFVQSLLNCSKKYLDKDINFDFSDGTAHTIRKQDCFDTFKGIDLEWNLVNINEDFLKEQTYYIDMFSSQEKLMSLLEEKWRNYDYEYYSHRFHTLGFYKLIELLPQSKFIYCRFNPIKAISNIQIKVPILLSPKSTYYMLYTYINSYKAMEEFIISKKPNNLLILDVDNLIYDDNTTELDKLVDFTNITDVNNDILKNLIHQYRQVNNNLKRPLIWEKFLVAYNQLNM